VARVLEITSVLWLGGCELVLSDQKGVAEVIPDGQTFQSLINISFPKISKLLGGGGVKKVSGHSIFH
jgi:hypothetical protein